MIVGVLIAYLDDDFFDEVMLQLQRTAQLPIEQSTKEKERRLPQVHALNCLKDVFTNSRLATRTERHWEQTLKIAIDCLNHET